MGSARLLHSVCSTWDQSTEKHRHLFIGYVAGMSCLEPETTTFFWSFEKDHFFCRFKKIRSFHITVIFCMKNTVVSSYSHFLYEKYGRFIMYNLHVYIRVSSNSILLNVAHIRQPVQLKEVKRERIHQPFETLIHPLGELFHRPWPLTQARVSTPHIWHTTRHCLLQSERLRAISCNCLRHTSFQTTKQH